MAVITEGQFELGTAIWGDRTPIIITDGEMPLPEVRGEDADNALGHGAYAGRDRLGSAVWTWDFETDFEDGEAMRAALDAFTRQWRRGLDLDPNELMVLRYNVYGKVRRVYGRPRRFDGGKPNLLGRWGRVAGAMEFKVTDPYFYDDEEKSVEIGRLAPPSSDGITLPTILPVVLGIPPGRTDNSFTVTGEAPTPVLVTFKGPVIDPYLTGPRGFHLALSGTIDAGMEVVVDTRSGTIRRARTDVRGMLKRGSRLKSRLTPGATTLTYGGTDPLNQSRVTVAWRDAHYNL